MNEIEEEKTDQKNSLKPEGRVLRWLKTSGVSFSDSESFQGDISRTTYFSTFQTF